MTKQVWLVIFFIALVADIAIMQYGADEWRIFSKPLIVFSLLAWLLNNRASSKYLPVKNHFAVALAFSIVGDVLLLFEPRSSLFFITGLVSFLIAHIFYIIAFNAIRKKQSISFSKLLLLPVLLYYVALIYILNDSLGDMKIPVMVYGLVISIMLAAALQLRNMKDRTSFSLLISGALLFIASDSMLAFNKFYAPWNGAGIAIMLSYGMAQLLITISAVRIVHAHTIVKHNKALAH